MKDYPKVLDEAAVGGYPAAAKAGGGFVWDEVLEYRVWCHPEKGADDVHNGNDYYKAFPSYKQAEEFSTTHQGTERPIALILQREYIDESEEGEYLHQKEERTTEWPVEFLSRPRRDELTISNFFAADAPANRLDVLRGIQELESEVDQNIYISEVNENIGLAIIIESDEHSVWAYILNVKDSQQKLVFAGFVCSRGTVVKESSEVQSYVEKGIAPPLMHEFKNEFSILDSLSTNDFFVEWLEYANEVRVEVKEELYLIMDYSAKVSYSKSISVNGPYGNNFLAYDNQ